MSIDVNVQNDLVIVTESSEDITVNVSNAAGPAGVGVPVGGITGQVLKKLSNTNYDTYWALDGGGVPYSGATGQVDLGNYDLKVQGLTIGKGNNALVNNTALGHSALLTITTGNFNTAVGYESLRNTTTGQYNTAVGQSSLFSNTTGSQNTAIGLNALVYNTTGGSNVVIGLDALQHNTTGSSNTAIGYNAGTHITGGSVTNTTASNSVFIGRDSKANADGQTNQIVIGQNAVGNGSNTATFGNTATTGNYFTGSINGGSFVKSGGTSSQFLKADGSVDSSTYVGGSGATGQVAYWNGTSSQTGSNNFQWDNTNQRLSITGQNLATTTTISAICASGTFSLNNASNHYVNTTLSQTSSQGSVSHALTNNSSLTGSFVLYGSAEGNNLFGTSRNSALALLNNNGTKFYIGTINSTDLIFGTTNLERMRLTAAGRLLLGTTSEGTQILQVQGDAFIRGTGNGSTTYALTIQSLNGTQIARFQNGGVVEFDVLNPNRVSLNSNGTISSPTSTFMQVGQGATDSRLAVIRSGNLTTQTGNVDWVAINTSIDTTRSFAPTTGTATMSMIRADIIVNQTGGANGITRGLYVNPTLTAAADWRSIEWSNNSGWGLYGAGTANNYLAGKLVIGTTTVSTFALDVNGTARVSGNVIFGGQIGAIGATFQIKQSDATIALQNTGTGNFSGFNLYNDATALVFSLQAGGTTSGIYAGNVLFGNRTTNGKILFVQGNGPASIGTWFSTGNLLIGSGSTDAGFKIDVEGTGRVSGDLRIGNDTTGILLRATGGMLISRNGLAITNGNDADVNMTAGSGALGICELFVGTSTTRPLCLNKNGNEVIIGQSTSTTNASSILTLVSTTKGFLPPRMTTTQKNAIGSPAAGLQVYDTTLNQMSYYNGTTWVNF
jgi:hypothetical protein